jgi:thiol-disulfide isomerase/thioredoxin
VMLKELLPAVVAALILSGGAAGGGPQKRGKPQRPAPAPAESKPAAPPKVTEIDEAALKSLLGVGAGRARPLLVNFWATWCAPCREEFPDLVKIRGRYAEDKLDFILVSLDDPSDIGKAVPEFLSEQRATALPAYLLHATDDSIAINLVDPTWSGELPATFIYDRSGNVVFKHKGRIKPDELRSALDAALKDKPPEAGARK